MAPAVEHTDRHFDTAAGLTEALAAALPQRLADGLAAGGGASLAVCGGTSPRVTFKRLARTPLDWSRVIVGLTDERWVPPSDPASNEGLARRTLLTSQAAAARLIGLYTGDPSPEGGRGSLRRATEKHTAAVRRRAAGHR